MTLRLVGAGLPRTGTSSLREGLRLLLDAPVHHMSEVFRHPEQAPAWVAAIEGRPQVWHENSTTAYLARGEARAVRDQLRAPSPTEDAPPHQ